MSAKNLLLCGAVLMMASCSVLKPESAGLENGPVIIFPEDTINTCRDGWEETLTSVLEEQYENTACKDTLMVSWSKNNGLRQIIYLGYREYNSLLTIQDWCIFRNNFDLNTHYSDMKVTIINKY